VISHGNRARATIVKVDEGQFTLDGHADFRHPQKVTWGLLWRGSIVWKIHFGTIQVPDRAFWALERHGGLGETGGERRCQKAVRDNEKRNWKPSVIWVVAPLPLAAHQNSTGPDIM
jgi:hypothetical protein